MKKSIITVLLFITTICCFGKISYMDSIYAYKKINNIKYKLGIENVIIHIDYIDPKQREFARDIFGYMYEKNDEYFICIKPRLKYDDIKIIITHELIHISQMYSGKLKVYKSGWVWKGEFYPLNTPYKKRLHEIDAKILESYYN